MKQIVLEDKEVQELITYYEDQLKQTEARLDEIKNILDRLNADSEKKKEKVQQKDSKKKKNESVKLNFQGKSEKQILEEIKRKMNWPEIIINYLENKQKMASIYELAEHGTQTFGIPDQFRKKVNLVVSGNVNGMVKKKQLIKIGTRAQGETLFALPQWCQNNGTVKDKYRP